MRLHIIGAGKVGRSLAKAYHSVGGEVGYLVNRIRRRAEESVDLVGAGVPITFGMLEDLTFEGMVAITVPDREIKSVVRSLSHADISRVSFVFHTSGYVESKVLEPLSKPYASLHPILAFGRVLEPCELRGVYYDVCGDEKGSKYARELVEKIGGVPISVDEREKKVLHLAAVVASNFSLSLMALSRELCRAVGLEMEEALVKLMYSVLANVENVGLDDAATGPVVRGDWDVVEGERRLMEELSPRFVGLYDELVELTRREFGAERAQDRRFEE